MSETSCPACGRPSADDARFCSACGCDLADRDATRSQLRKPSVPIPAAQAELQRMLEPDYEILKPLGRGGMGVVYLAREIALDRRVAVKVMSEDAVEDQERVERFLREARTAASLKHPNIVPVHAVGRRDSLCFFTMAWVDGRTLGQIVNERGPFAPAEACRLMDSVLDAVGHAHAKGVLHRDIKPSNVMVDADGRAQVMDFGLAKRAGQTSLSSAGSFHGTPEYVSPEQADGHGATAASDIYALGLTLFFLLAGRHLVAGDSLSEILAMHLKGDLRELVKAEERVPPALRSVILWMVEREPSRRPLSLEVAREELKRSRDALDSGAQAPAEASGAAIAEPGAASDSGARSRRPRRELGNLLDRLAGADDEGADS